MKKNPHLIMMKSLGESPLFHYTVSRYSTDPGDINIPIGCVVRALPDTITADMIKVKCLSQLDEQITLEDGEELVSHIVQLVPTDPDGIFDVSLSK